MTQLPNIQPNAGKNTSWILKEKVFSMCKKFKLEHFTITNAKRAAVFQTGLQLIGGDDVVQQYHKDNKHSPSKGSKCLYGGCC